MLSREDGHVIRAVVFVVQRQSKKECQKTQERQRKEECKKVGFSREETLSDRGRKSVQRLASVGKRDIFRQRKEECTKVGFSMEERYCQTEERRVYKGRLQ